MGLRAWGVEPGCHPGYALLRHKEGTELTPEKEEISGAVILREPAVAHWRIFFSPDLARQV